MEKSIWLPISLCVSTIFIVQCRSSKLSSTSSGNSTDVISCDMSSQVHTWTNPDGNNPENEKMFYKVAKEDGALYGSKITERFSKTISRLKDTLQSAQCAKDGLRCKLAVIHKKTQDMLQTVSYALYSHTLKVREIDGEQRVLVKGYGAEPFEDPRQPGGVFRRYANGYVWMFRSHAGDLHPGFILAKLEGKPPEKISSVVFERARPTGAPGTIDETYGRVLKFHEALIKEGFIKVVNRGYGDDSLQNLYLVDREKIPLLTSHSGLRANAENIFGKEKADSVIGATKDLFAERAQRIIEPNSKGKYEITREMLKLMKRDLPFVSIQNGMVQCSDHHRIMAAHDLGMAIQVGVIRGFISFN